jgi:RNA-binding protein YhbY
MEKIGHVQIGKQGVTKNFIETLRNHFNRLKVVKVTALRSSRNNKEDVKRMAEEIQKELGNNYAYRVIGFTIALKKLRKNLKARNVKE